MINRNRLVVGSIAGVVAGALVALITQPESDWISHLIISVILGALFGLIFGSQLRTPGSALVWGQAFGLLWWLLGYSTFLPLLYGQGLAWSIADMRTNFILLPAYIIVFGAILGLGSYFLGRFLPIVKVKEQVGLIAASQIAPLWQQAVIVGAIGGTLGAWIFLRGVESTIFFPLVSSMVGMDSFSTGAIIHYSIGIIIGITFALLFYRDIRGLGPAIIWGMSYGILWWFIGPLTLLPILTGSPIDWTLESAQANYAPLLAHILYGAIIGLFFAITNGIWRKLFVDSDPLNRTREGGGTSSIRGSLMGILGGIIGGLLFAFVFIIIGALPTVASIIGSQSPTTGFIVHIIIAIIIGITFGLFFQRVGISYGVCMSWGTLYGLLWFVLGAMTLLPALLRQPIDWSLQTIIANYAFLVGHLLYGLGLGLFFQFLAVRYDTELRFRNWNFSNEAAPAMWASTLLFGVMMPLLL